MEDIQRLVDEISGRLEPVALELDTADWELNTRGDAASRARAVAARKTWLVQFSQPHELAAVKAAYERRATVDDPLLRRSVEALFHLFVENHLPPDQIDAIAAAEAEIVSRYNNLRGRVGDRELSANDITQVLRNSTNSAERRAAWEASKQVGAAVADLVIELVHRRNAAARALGYRDYYAMRMAQQEIDEQWLFGLLADLRDATDEPFARHKGDLDRRLSARLGIPVDELMPWHYADPFFQERPDVGDVSLDAFFEQADLEELTLRTYDGMGFEIRDIVARSDLYERPGKSQHAFCTDLGRRGDVRVLCNLRPTARWACTNLHEFGHAIYFKHLAADLPFLLRVPAHTNCTEAVAMLMGRLAARPDWLDTINGAHAASKGVTRTALEAQTGLAMLILVRWVLVMALFERDLYSYPDRPNLNALWWDHVERFQLLRRPDGRDAPDWAAKIHLAQAPVYYHNYLLGELIASQLEHTLEGEAVGGFVDNPVAGAFLRERMFALGGRLSWHETVAQVTGEPLTPKYFIDQYVK